MTNNKPTRASQTKSDSTKVQSQAKTVAPKARPKVWTPPPYLDTPNAPDGWRHRWVRTEILGFTDTKNIQACASFLNQYYDPNDLSKFQSKYVPDCKVTKPSVHGPDKSSAGIEASLDIEYIMAMGEDVPTQFWSTNGQQPHNPSNEPFLIWLQNLANLTDAEKQRVMEQYAIRNIQENLMESKEELALITLIIEEERKKALGTLKLLAASREAQRFLKERATEFEKKLSGNDNILKEKDLALREARLRLSVQEEKATASIQEVANLTMQTNSLKERLGELTAILDTTIEKDSSNNVEIKSLGAKLNAALAKVASEQKLRAQLEEKERKRLENETKKLREYRSVFFGRLKNILGNTEGIDVVGDRFMFSSEVLFDRGSADIGVEGKVQLDTISNVLKDISKKIPEDINWVLRVDGHTDKTPVSYTHLRAHET